VIRDKKIVEFNNLSIPSGEKLGINLYPIGSTKIDIDKLKTENVSGSSGGLIFTLVLIDSLTTGDLTGNRKIAGTGTINLDGSIGAIDGVIYKYKAATDSNSDVFFVPSANFDALKNVDSKNTEIVSVDSIYDAIDYLCNEGGESTICNNI
jgi:PDZ domain-containing protein